MTQPDRIETFQGFLFDIYNFEEEIQLWALSRDGSLLSFKDVYHPIIYADGPPRMINKLTRRLHELGALQKDPKRVIKRHFYQNSDRSVMEYRITRPSLLYKIRRKLFALYRKMDLYNTDVEIPTAYLQERGVHPLAQVRFYYRKVKGRAGGPDENQLVWMESLEDQDAFDYELPPFRVMHMKLKKSHRLGFTAENPLILSTARNTYELKVENLTDCISRLNQILKDEEPDIILSEFGDECIMPALYKHAQEHSLRLDLDRDRYPPPMRKIVTQGSSFSTYGSVIYKAPSYPLFGRWHLDTANSFVYKETELKGVIELARLSCIPVQRLARSSTGTALTAIETRTALNRNYLIPWQKSIVEQPKTAYQLLTVDKGGLVFVPSAGDKWVFENVAQIDFNQMYPSIMVNHNISPESINCSCCANRPDVERVPEAGYHICKNRRGIVAQSLENILRRRAYYKQKVKSSAGALKDEYDARQSSLKWMLVTSFGYLGYRNAKFGRIESHESVTAFGREKLLSAMEIAQSQGFSVLHGITDCLFIDRGGDEFSADSLQSLCRDIGRHTGVDMGIDGLFSWVIFLPSKSDPEMPVTNRYLGRFAHGELKIRGISARRKDIAPFIKEAQLKLLEVMKQADSLAELRLLHEDMVLLYSRFDDMLRVGDAPWESLLMRKTVTRGVQEYRVENATVLTMKDIKSTNPRTKDIQAGEKVRYVALNRKNQKKDRRYISEERATAEFQDKPLPYDKEYYRLLLFEAFEEIWQFLAPESFFERKPSNQLYLEL